MHMLLFQMISCFAHLGSYKKDVSGVGVGDRGIGGLIEYNVHSVFAHSSGFPVVFGLI